MADKTIPMNAKENITVTIKNSGKVSRNITILLSNLYSLVETIRPSDFVLSAGEQKEVVITIDSSKGFGDYDGAIGAETPGASISIPAHIKISAVQTNNTSVNNTIPPGTTKPNYSFVGWLMIILAVLVVAGYIYFKLRKKPSSPLLEQLKKMKTEPIQSLQQSEVPSDKFTRF